MEQGQLVFSPPLSLDPKLIFGDGEKQKSLLARIVDIIKDLKPGADLAQFQVPVQMNIPKSQLQAIAEPVYCCGQDLLGACADAPTPLQRFLRVVAWHISITRILPYAQAPFNPILGETHHVSWGSLNVLIEQVSHHPPISALYATNKDHNLRFQLWHNIGARFYGNKAEATFYGKRILWLDSHQERYEMTMPKLLTRLFPASGNDWVGSSTVKCSSSGLEATIVFKPRPFFGLRGTLGHITGKIRDTNSNTVLYEISGRWNRVVTLKDMKTEETTVLFDAQAALTNLKGLALRGEKAVLESTETMMVWRAAMEGLVRRDWEMARKAKHEVEERQRALAKQRKLDGKVWTPKHFVEVDGEDRWQWRHTGQPVPEGLLVVPE